jgi:hypothetical protein
MDQVRDLDDLTEFGLTVTIFAIQYLLELWEFNGVCHPDCSVKIIEHLGAFIVQV